MNFNKLYIIPLLGAALGLGACSNQDESIFDQSAAERLEAGQKEYFSTLCADGGLWAMEYFSNTEEPGYLFVMQFNADKSVNIHTDHKWIGSTYKSELSLWDVINDNGNVLTFNSYNTLFHIFSTPENIEGPDAPKDSNDKDVDEQGYGHNGDYEFLLMENTDGNIRLLGKKRALYTYLRQLPSDTDVKQYLANAAAKRALFTNKKFPTYVMTETATGATYDVTGLSSGVVKVMPYKTTSEYSRTETKASIITSTGLRPYKPFDFIRENDTHFTVNEFTWATDGSLVAPGVRITAPTPATTLKNRSLTWDVDLSTISPDIKHALDEANAELNSLGLGAQADITQITIGYNADYGDGRIRFGVTCIVGTELPCNYYGEVTTEEGTEKLKFTFNLLDLSAETIIGMAPKVKTLMELFAGEYEATNINPITPSSIIMKNLSNTKVSFNLRVL